MGGQTVQAQPITTGSGNGAKPGAPTGQTVLFEDDFRNAKQGSFPERWQLVQVGASRVIGGIQELNGQKALVLVRGTSGGFEPELPKEGLGRDFTLEYDYYLELKNCKSGCATGISFEDPLAPGVNEQKLSIWSGGQVTYFCRKYNSANDKNEYASVPGKYPGAYDNGAWHHVALSYKFGALRLYLDGSLSLEAGSCFLPGRIFLVGRAPFGIRNVVFTGKGEIGKPASRPASKPARAETAEQMLPQAIYFEARKFQVTGDGLLYLRQLAVWLKQHPGIRILINGHADYEGDAAFNVQLSMDRALAVRAQLMELGINGNRLITKGYGTSILADTAPTPSARAKNRRVELIKL